MIVRSAFILLIFFHSILAADVLFPSGYVFPTLTEVPSDEFYDPQETGSVLLQSDNDLKQLTKFIRVAQWRSSDSTIYRAHPFFLELLQNITLECMKEKVKLELQSGYKPTNRVNKNSKKWPDLYAPTGAAAEMKVVGGTKDTKDAMEIVIKNIIRISAIALSEKGRDLGLVLLKDTFFLFMTGSRYPSKPVYEVDGSDLVQDSATFKDLIYSDFYPFAIQPNLIPTYCDPFPILSSGESYPQGNAASIVGSLDVPIKRSSRDDFNNLIQYPADNIVFEGIPDSMRTASWCGDAKTKCVWADIKDCHLHEVGNDATLKCPSRTMAPRMLEALMILNALTQTHTETMKSKVKVLLAWTEPNANDPWGGAESENSLHFEGRQAVLGLEKGFSFEAMQHLSKLAICAGFDFVRNNEVNVTVAVMKQKDFHSNAIGIYKQASLPPVSPPLEKMKYYEMPSTITQDEMLEYPLFDSEVGAKQLLFDDVTVADFRSKEDQFRYLRLHPLLPKCLEAINTHFKQEVQLSAQFKSTPKINIVRAFMSSAEEQSQFESTLDRRLYTHSLGIGLHLHFDQPNDHFNVWSLTQAAATQCAPMFYAAEQVINLGVYKNGVFITFQSKFEMWFECDTCSELTPPSRTQEEFIQFIANVASLAASGRLIQPLDPLQACAMDYPPEPQSEAYVFKVDPLNVETEHCDLSSTPYCVHTTPARQAAVDEIIGYIKRKPFSIAENKLRESLTGCLGSCNACSYGTSWAVRLQHCDNLLHWMPFHTLNGQQYNVITNLFPRGDEEARSRACYGRGQHCIDASPMLAILYDVMDRTIRWEPNKPLMEKLYSPTENPLPLLKQASRIYALDAYGEVNVWVRRSEDLETMREALKTIFVYNRNVSMVHIYVLEDSATSSIITVLEGYLDEWSNNGCPTTSRLALSPYKLHKSADAFSNAHDTSNGARQLVLKYMNSWDTNGLFDNNSL